MNNKVHKLAKNNNTQAAAVIGTNDFNHTILYIFFPMKNTVKKLLAINFEVDQLFIVSHSCYPCPRFVYHAFPSA
jgi:hypothetical protein